jgi:hypothetical protein
VVRTLRKIVTSEPGSGEGTGYDPDHQGSDLRVLVDDDHGRRVKEPISPPALTAFLASDDHGRRVEEPLFVLGVSAGQGRIPGHNGWSGPLVTAAALRILRNVGHRALIRTDAWYS